MSSGEKRSALLKVRKLVREAREGKGAGKGQRHRAQRAGAQPGLRTRDWNLGSSGGLLQELAAREKF